MNTIPVTNPSVLQLVSEIVVETQQLTRQEVALVKAEVSRDLSIGFDALIFLGVGIAIVCLGGALIPFLLTDLILELADGTISRLGAYGIVSGVFLIVGLLIAFTARRRLGAVFASSAQ